MALYPVIMCGGAGTRLWPASRPSRPKQFIPLAGNRSPFQETLLRVSPLAGKDGRLLVVGGVAHRAAILAQLAETGVSAQVLLEPEARDSAAAMAAAAAWVNRVDPDGILIFVASDHHIPDHHGFRAAAKTAAQAATGQHIVTMGVRPTEPSAAYGYIKPHGRGLSAVESFVEKPDRALAAEYIAAGYLWNSGNFIVSARTFLDELKTYAPGVEDAVSRSIGEIDSGDLVVLGPSFSSAPKISIDYAVMEHTRLASVLEVDFAWSDLGAWDSIAHTGEGSVGQHVMEDTDGCLVRAADGVLVAALGVRNLAIIVEKDAVLVSDLSRSQDVRRVVERIRVSAPRYLDFEHPPAETLAYGGRRFADWLRLRALPLWSSQGLSATGAFADVLTLEGRQVQTPRRARVQARQVFVYAQAGLLGWEGAWRMIVGKSLERLYADYFKPDGQARAVVAPDGSPLNDISLIYDQAFVLFALATARKAGIEDDALEARAAGLRDGLLARAMTNGALREGDDHPYQANAHMHVLEACLAWEGVSKDPAWGALADQIVKLALEVFIDRDGGFLREFFDENWKPAAGHDGRLVEPGHQFEWAWLLTRYARARGEEARTAPVAKRLYAAGRRGVLHGAQIAIDALDDDGSVRSARARLWPQTEWLKAALILAETATDGERLALLADAAAAQRALWGYLTPDGLWHDKRLADGSFIDEPAPASSFYHIMMGFVQLVETGRGEGLDGLTGLSL